MSTIALSNLKGEVAIMITTDEIGKKITVARKLKNLSQAQLAEQLSVSAQAVGKWERGESMPDIITFYHVAKILGTDLNYFIEENTDISKTEWPLPPATFDEAFDEPLDDKKQNSKKSGWDMSGGNWMDADFSGLHGLAERFNGSNILKCQFIESEMSQLVLKGNNISGSDFSRSDLSHCQFIGSNLIHNTFIGCNLSGSKFSRSNVNDCNFSGADLTDIHSKWGTLKNADLTGAILNRANFELGSLSNITFHGELTECSFVNCDFTKVIFDGTTFHNCFFKNAKLKRVTFVNCLADRLTYSFMKACKADLAGVAILADEK
ncbi:pentapeptide repeat-containing protein [Lachnospiraceae bacterium ZAX-1]